MLRRIAFTHSEIWFWRFEPDQGAKREAKGFSRNSLAFYNSAFKLFPSGTQTSKFMSREAALKEVRKRAVQLRQEFRMLEDALS